jgi:hypothetical protein
VDGCEQQRIKGEGAKGASLSELDWRKGLLIDLAASQRLAHLVGSNGVFTALIRSARRRPGARGGAGRRLLASLWQ